MSENKPITIPHEGLTPQEIEELVGLEPHKYTKVLFIRRVSESEAEKIKPLQDNMTRLKDLAVSLNDQKKEIQKQLDQAKKDFEWEKQKMAAAVQEYDPETRPGVMVTDGCSWLALKIENLTYGVFEYQHEEHSHGGFDGLMGAILSSALKKMMARDS